MRRAFSAGKARISRSNAQMFGNRRCGALSRCNNHRGALSRTCLPEVKTPGYTSVAPSALAKHVFCRSNARMFDNRRGVGSVPPQ